MHREYSRTDIVCRDGILERHFFEVSGHKLESSQIQVFVWFSTQIFLFYRIIFMKRLEFSCFMDFLVRNVKPKKNMVLF